MSPKKVQLASDQEHQSLRQRFWQGVLLWTLVVGLLTGWSTDLIEKQMLAIAVQEADTNLNKDQMIREWSTRHGGVYVLESGESAQLPIYEHIPDYIIERDGGADLILVNPASMVRELLSRYESLYGVVGRLTSTHPLNPNNAPDDWEKEALAMFQQGASERLEVTTIEGEPHLRLLRPMDVLPGCLKCHAHQQGYAIGKTQGGYGVSVPLKEHLARASEQQARLWLSFFVLWGIGFAFALKMYVDGKRNIQERSNTHTELVKANRAKDEFLATMSHELRTPLTSIIGNAGILHETTLDEDQQGLLRTVSRSSNNLLSLINDVLDYSKIKSGKFNIEPAPFSLQEMLYEIEQMYIGYAEDAGIEIEFRLLSTPDYKLWGDSSRIEQILLNLLSNAIKFTEQGGVRLECSIEDETLLFSVEDTGIGMSPEAVERLFVPFEQADNTISKRFGGTGLGLYISQSLARAMGGEITVNSEQGQGSCFVLKLPYQQSDRRIDEDVPRERSRILKGGLCFKGHVLIAEDAHDVQVLMRRLLESMGLTVATAENGMVAVEHAKQQPFDLILMDMQMPEMDGIEATRQLRAAGIETPVIALTANVMPKHREDFIDAGADGFLEKPINFEKLENFLVTYTNPQETRKPH